MRRRNFTYVRGPPQIFANLGDFVDSVLADSVQSGSTLCLVIQKAGLVPPLQAHSRDRSCLHAPQKNFRGFWVRTALDKGSPISIQPWTYHAGGHPLSTKDSLLGLPTWGYHIF